MGVQGAKQQKAAEILHFAVPKNLQKLSSHPSCKEKNTSRKKKRKEMWNVNNKIEDHGHHILSGSPEYQTLSICVRSPVELVNLDMYYCYY